MEIWTARGAVNALIVPLVAVSAARTQVVIGYLSIAPYFISFCNIARHALYLLAMSAAGYYLRFSGGAGELSCK